MSGFLLECGMKMGQIRDTVEVFQRLRKKKYRIIIEDGTEFILVFSPEHYHHFAGFQYLTDFPQICTPKAGTHKFYGDVKNDRIKERDIVKSVKYKEIEERITFFSNLEEILASGKGKVIVEFDKTQADSQIEAKYYLYKREGAAFEGDVTYYALFIGYDERKKRYFPRTFIVEHTARYAQGQNILNCSIEVIDK